VHDRIMGIQASTLTMLMNPTTLERVYDNEFRVPSDQDMITLPELLNAIGSAIWNELDENVGKKKYTARKPMISSLRRNLQQEHLDRLITLSMPGNGSNGAYKPIANLALMEIRKIHSNIAKVLKDGDEKLDPYTTSHLAKMQGQIDKVLNAEYIYNANDLRGGAGGLIIILGKEADEENLDDRF